MDFLTLGILGLLFRGTACSTLLNGGPVGVLMCRQICVKTLGCKFYTYLPCKLTCYSGKQAGNRGSVGVELKKTFDVEQITYENCQQGSRILITKSKNSICLKGQKPSGNVSDKMFLPRSQLKNIRKKGYKELISGDWLKLYKVLKNWPNSMKQCKQDGGILAQLNKSFKWVSIPKLLKLKGDKFAANKILWIGLRDITNDDKFQWADGTLLKDNSRWNHATEPTGKLFGKDEDCGGVMYHNGKFTLYDQVCTRKAYFLCEVKVKP